MKPFKMVQNLFLGHVDFKLLDTELSKPITIYKWCSEDYALALKTGDKPLLGIGELVILFMDCCDIVGLSDNDMINLQVRSVIHVHQALRTSYDDFFTGSSPVVHPEPQVSVVRVLTLEDLQYLFLDVTQKMVGSHEDK